MDSSSANGSDTKELEKNVAFLDAVRGNKAMRQKETFLSGGDGGSCTHV
ncbi:MAG: hypothetical protein HYV34_03980 [Candidatus Kerfeldbacteria bacterium]|nr:hypothetical protein [Candidatus Kerfeldbacteria bacterium]